MAISIREPCTKDAYISGICTKSAFVRGVKPRVYLRILLGSRVTLADPSLNDCCFILSMNLIFASIESASRYSIDS